MCIIVQGFLHRGGGGLGFSLQNQTNFFFDTACTTHKLNFLLPKYTHLHCLSVLCIIKYGNESCLIMHSLAKETGAVGGKPGHEYGLDAG